MRSLLWVLSGCGAIRSWSVCAVMTLLGGLLLLAPASASASTTINATTGQPFSGAVAQVSCSIEGTATINWGDGSATSPGTQQSNGSVDGTHTYESPGTYDGTVTYLCSGADKTTVDFTADVTTATTTTLTSSDNPSASGAQITFTATVSPVPDGGYVEFTDNGLPAGAGGSEVPDCAPTVLSAGVADCTTHFAPGAYSIVVTYSGDANFASSFSATLTQTVGGNPTTTTLTDTDGLASVVDSSDSFSATVSPLPDGGTVAFTDDGVPIPGCAAIPVTTTEVSTAYGVAQYCQDNFAFSSQGYHTIVATYSGDANYATSSGTVTVAVGPFATTTTLTSSKDSVAVGATVTFTATVSPTPNQPPVLVGDFVVFTDNGLSFDDGGSLVNCLALPGFVSLAGGSVATCTATFSTKGYYSILAQYGSGDPTYAGSSASLLFLSVGVRSPGIIAGAAFLNPRNFLMLKDEVSGPGVIKGTAIAKLAASGPALTARAADSTLQQVVYGSGRETVTKAGSVALTIKPTAAGLAALKKHHSLRLTITVKFTPKGSKRAITRTEHVTVTYKHSTNARTTSEN